MLFQSINDSTWKKYQGSIQEWAQFCINAKCDIFKPRVEEVLEFLSTKYQQGASYTTLNTHRSAIAFVYGEWIGKEPTISRLMKGVFKLKPPKPRYEEIYNLEPVIAKIQEMSPLSTLSLPELTEKLVILLALITAHRRQTLF